LEPTRLLEPGSLSALLADLAHVPDAAPDAAVSTTLRPGGRVGRYELGAELGRGSFGVVFEARDTELERQVAFKVVRPGRTDVAADQLQREADTIARLSHPSLVTLLDAGRCEDGPFLVLELLRGTTLKQRLRQGPVPSAEAFRLVLEVARGLAHAHARGVVHRDLKPSNVFLCQDGSVRLLDFGLAHAFGRRRLDGGTPDFMAPEQWRGAPEDERTDVFALGVLLYRLLADELPFPDDGGRSATSPDPAPRLDVPDRPGLGALVGRMLEKDPVDRPRDAAAVVTALEALQGDEGSTQTTLSGSVRIRRRAPRRLIRLATLGAGAIALVAALAAAALFGRGGTDPGRGGEDAALPSVAVLPFTDLSPEGEQQYFSDGLSEEILNALAQVEGLKVAGRTSSFAFRGRAGDLRAIGRQLGVGAVLEGSVRLDGARVRVTAQLIKAADGYHLWSQTFERELKGVFAVQDEIAAAVVEALKVKLLPGRMPSSREFRTSNPAVYDLYLQARKLQRRDHGPEWISSEPILQRALALDPDYAPAWAALAISLYNNHGNEGPTRQAIRAGREQALAAAERAVALAPDLADGYMARGELRAFITRDWKGALADMERAGTLNPGDPEVLWRQAMYVVGPLGRFTQAIAYARQASERDPLSANPWSTLSCLYLATDQLPLARSTALRSLELDPQGDTAPICLATADLLDHKPAAAIQTIQRTGQEVFQLQFEAMARHDLGQRQESDAALAALKARHAHDAPFQIACVHAWRGEKDEAFSALDRAFELNDGGLQGLKLETLLRNLRDDPRYPALLARLELPAD
jgi:TolB-like protein/tetratricopeptide (TPR) repeat protein